MNSWSVESSSPPDLALSSDRVDLWFLFVHDVFATTGLTDLYRDFLTAQEKQQEQRFYFARDRHRYLLTRALVRTVLSRYIPIAASDWHFEPSAYGRPMIVNNHELIRNLSFNISHTDGLIVLAVTRASLIGVDTESTCREISLEVAHRYFSPKEVTALRALPVRLQRRRFLDLWTLKESYIKARGMGLSIPLNMFSFNLDENQSSVISFDNDFDDLPSRWIFYQLSLSNEYAVALCVERQTSKSPTLKSRRIVPLASEQPLACSINELGTPGTGE
jgi:4'-phosphopantetheinyl transferase